MFWLNNYKDACETWTCLKTKEQAVEYMAEDGGSYSIKEGPTFDPNWIEEEREYRAFMVSKE